MYKGNMYEYVEKRAREIDSEMQLYKEKVAQEDRYRLRRVIRVPYGQDVYDSEDFEEQVEKFIKWTTEHHEKYNSNVPRKRV